MSDFYLVAQIAGQAVAIASDRVGSVVDLAEITPVPRVAAHVLGLAALRSRVVTVIDTPVALRLPHSCAANRRAIVIEGDGHHYALLVDAVEDVIGLDRQPLGTVDPVWAAVAGGTVERDGRHILVVDAAALLAMLISPSGAFR